MALNLRDIVARIRVVFDKRSGDDAEEKAKGSLNRIGDVAKKVGGIIAAAFAVRQLIEWGKAAVGAAAEADRVFRNLIGTLEAVGAASDKNIAKFKAAGQAFKDATVYDDDDFYAAAQRFIALTGNHAQAVTAVGLAANVAARYHNGQLEPAIEAVSRAFSGQARVLRAYGITTQDVNEGLRILAERSMGAAEERANSFVGQVERLTVAKGNLFEAIGNVIIAGGQEASVIGRLITLFEALTGWVERNQNAIATWVTGGLNVAITVARGFKLVIEEIADALAILMLGPWTVAVKGTALLAQGYALVASAAARFIPSIRAHADEVKLLADQLHRAADANAKLLLSSSPRRALGGGGGGASGAQPGAPGSNTTAEGGIFVTADPAPVEEAADKIEAAAVRARTAWDEFSDGVKQGFDEAGEAANGFAAGMAAGIINGIKAAAQFKAGEQIAEGTAKLAAGIWPPNPAALLAAGKHFAAAALFSALGGAAGKVANAVAGGSSSGGGGSIPGPRDIGGSGAQNAGGPQKITRIYIDGIDPRNPRHQELSAEAIRMAAERGELYEIIPSSYGARG
jgi:hypothetical protein